MKKICLTMILIFLLIGSFALANEPNNDVSQALKKLEEAQNMLEAKKRTEAVKALMDAKSQITRVAFPLTVDKAKRKFVTDRWLVKIPKEPLVLPEMFNHSEEEYYVDIKVAVENLTKKKQRVFLNGYLIDTDGRQHRTGNSGDGPVLGGAKTVVRCGVQLDRDEFEPGIYTFVVGPRGGFKRGVDKQVRVKLKLTKEKLKNLERE